MSLLSFGGWTMPETFDLSAWASPVEQKQPEVELDIFADTTAPDFTINTMMPNLNTSEGNLLGFTELEMTPQQKVQYGIANEQEKNIVASDPFAALSQINTNIAQAATTPEGAAQIAALQENAAKYTPEEPVNTPSLVDIPQAELNNALASGDQTKIALATAAVEAAKAVEASPDKKPIMTGDIYSGFEFAPQNSPEWMQYQQAMGAVSEYDYNKWKAGTQGIAHDPLFNAVLGAATGGAWNVATGALSTVDAAVNGNWEDAIKSGAGTYISYLGVESNKLLDDAKNLDSMGYADAADTLRQEAEALKKTAQAVGGVSNIVDGDIATGLLTGAPLIGVDPVGSVMETVFGVTSENDAANNYKFGGGFDVSAASEGIVKAGGTLIDTGGDIGKAAEKGLLTYAKEGGSLPDLGLDLKGSGSIDWPYLKLNADLPEWLKFNPDFDYKAFALSGLALPEWLKINGGNLNLPDELPYPRINLGSKIEGDWFDNPEGFDINLDVNNPFEDFELNLPKIPSVDIGLPNINTDINLPNINAPEFDVNLSGLETDFNVDGFDIGEFEGFNADLPSLNFDLSLGEGSDLEGVVTTPKGKKIPNISTVATLLQKMTPKQKNDYLEMLIRSMQA